MSCNKGNLVDSVARVMTGVYTHQQIKKSIECKKVNRSPLFCAHPRQGVFNWMSDSLTTSTTNDRHRISGDADRISRTRTFLKITNSIAQLTKGVILATEFGTFFIGFLRVLMD